MRDIEIINYLTMSTKHIGTCAETNARSNRHPPTCLKVLLFPFLLFAMKSTVLAAPLSFEDVLIPPQHDSYLGSGILPDGQKLYTFYDRSAGFSEQNVNPDTGELTFHRSYPWGDSPQEGDIYPQRKLIKLSDRFLLMSGSAMMKDPSCLDPSIVCRVGGFITLEKTAEGLRPIASIPDLQSIGNVRSLQTFIPTENGRFAVNLYSGSIEIWSVSETGILELTDSVDDIDYGSDISNEVTQRIALSRDSSRIFALGKSGSIATFSLDQQTGGITAETVTVVSEQLICGV